MSEKITLVLLDNHKLLRAGLRALLTGIDEFKVVDEGCYDQAFDLVEKFHPDILLINLMSCEFQNQENTISEILNTNPNLSVLVIANSSEDKIVWHALKQGALGCLLCVSEPQEIYQAVHALVNGGSFLPSVIGRKIIQDYKRKDIPQKSGLSSQQILVLRLMSQGNTNKDIASQLVISKRTVEMHIYQIFKKMEVGNRTQAIQKAVHDGILDMTDFQSHSDNNGH